MLLLAWWLGLYEPPDRAALTTTWTALAPDHPDFRVLFVGARWYTRRLTRSLRRASVVTIDRDPRAQLFGGRTHRTVALEDLARTREDPFNLAVVNGIFGWGIDTVEDAERAVSGLYEKLLPGSILVLGVNERRPQTPDLQRVPALRAFQPVAPPPFGVHRYVVNSPLERAHTFLFFRRP